MPSDLVALEVFDRFLNRGRHEMSTAGLNGEKDSRNGVADWRNERPSGGGYSRARAKIGRNTSPVGT
jgi:hypothetical protein